MPSAPPAGASRPGSLEWREARPVALVHDWLTGMRGGERVLEALAEMFPGARLFTLFRRPGSVSAALESLPATTSFLQGLPFLSRGYRYYLPLFPAAARSLRLTGHPLVISSSHCVAKGVRVDPGALHVCYCHTPMRYAWDRFDDYFGRHGGTGVPRPLARAVVARLRRWDVATSARVDLFIANSRHVAARIQRAYGRRAVVVPPPVDVERFRPTGEPRGDHYLIVSALVPYKRVDVAIEAFRGTSRRLRIVGDGPDLARLRARAGREVTFLGRIPDSELAREYSRARAVLVPGCEDAGIVPLEAMACGRPVVALRLGGVPELVEPRGPERESFGLLYDGEEPRDLASALDRFESQARRDDGEDLRRHACLHDRRAFQRGIEAALDSLLPSVAHRAAS